MSQPTILCVDDDITILMSLKAQLKYAFGSRLYCEVAENPQIAWEIIEDIEARGDALVVVVSDWLMPETRGDAFLISVHEKYPDVMKIMLTGHAETDAIKRAKEQANLEKCLSKPWEKDELVAIVSRALDDTDAST